MNQEQFYEYVVSERVSGNDLYQAAKRVQQCSPRFNEAVYALSGWEFELAKITRPKGGEFKYFAELQYEVGHLKGIHRNILRIDKSVLSEIERILDAIAARSIQRNFKEFSTTALSSEASRGKSSTNAEVPTHQSRLTAPEILEKSRESPRWAKVTIALIIITFFNLAVSRVFNSDSSTERLDGEDAETTSYELANRGWNKFAINEFGGAEEDAHKALSLNRSNCSALSLWGTILSEVRSDHARAVEVHSTAISCEKSSTYPDLGYVYRNAAQAHGRHGDCYKEMELLRLAALEGHVDAQDEWRNGRFWCD